MKKTALAIAALTSTFIAAPAMAHQAGDVILRAGPILAVPNASTNSSVFDFDVSSNAQLGLTGTYMFTDNVGLELLAATPFSHEITLGNIDVAKVKQLPPSLYLQYYFLDKNAGSRPYIGAGVNYTRFFNSNEQLAGVSDLNLKSSWGPIVNAGIDIKLSDNLFFNTSVWYAKIKSKATFKLAGEEQKVDVTVDPTILFMGLGYSF